MVDVWSNCRVEFPVEVGEVSGCTVERRDECCLVVTVPGGVARAVISAIASLPRDTGRAFPIHVSLLGGSGFSVPQCTLSDHTCGESDADRAARAQAWRGNESEERTHIFTFQCM
jgi:hypothetical protein